MANKYSVIVMRDTDDGIEETKRIFVSSLNEGNEVFAHQSQMLEWSLNHKMNMGLQPNDRGAVMLWDHGCGYELREAQF